jgi:serine beta-lactamase-like protein LACTB, mitochondrial
MLLRRTFVPLLVCAFAARAELAPDKLGRIQQIVSKEMSRASIPGATVTVATGGEIRWSGAFGMADVENSVPMTPGAMLRLASISKSVTAVALMQLVEQGKIDLEAPIQRYVPSFPEKPWPVTVRQVMGHTAGIRHYRGVEMNSAEHYTDLLTPMKTFAGDPLLFEPDTQYSYSTYGYTLLGAAVEQASGMKLMDYFREKIFRPAGMTHIRDDSSLEMIPRRVHGYQLVDGRLLNCILSDTSNKIPGGGLISTSEDLVKFILALDRGVLLKKETFARMMQPGKLKDGKLTSYGLGLQLERLGEVTAIGHTGGQRGAQTNLVLVPGKGIAVGLMLNLEATPVLMTLTRELVEALE